MPKAKLPDKEFEWSSELAYAIGLITTDGCLSNDGRHIIMRSSETDLLKTFKKCLRISNKICETKNGDIYSYRVQFGDVQFYNWLIKIGLFPAKTYTIGKIDVPNKYFQDFLRGHLDGDGSIHAYTDRYNIYRGRNYTNKRVFVKFISASQAHILWLRKTINALAAVKGALICSKPSTPRRVSIWQIKFAKHESIKLLKWMYYQPTVPCLARKRKIAENAFEIISKQKRREYTRI